MRVIRDFILIVCAIITTACSVYLVANLEIARVYLGDTSAPWGPFIKSQVRGPTADDILKRLKSADDAGSLPEGYSKSARDRLKEQIEKSGAK